MVALHRRHLHDMDTISTGPQHILSSFLNNIHPTVKFTCDFSFTSIPFLDVNVSLQDDDKIFTNLYTKPTDKHQYLLYISHIIPYIPVYQTCYFFQQLFSLGLDSAAFVQPTRLSHSAPMNLSITFTNVAIAAIYNELTISHEQKHLCPMTLPHWTKQNVFPSLSPTTQPFVPSRPLFANMYTFTSLFHHHVAITSLKLHPLQLIDVVVTSVIFQLGPNFEISHNTTSPGAHTHAEKTVLLVNTYLTDKLHTQKPDLSLITSPVTQKTSFTRDTMQPLL